MPWTWILQVAIRVRVLRIEICQSRQEELITSETVTNDTKKEISFSNIIFPETHQKDKSGQASN